MELKLNENSSVLDKGRVCTGAMNESQQEERYGQQGPKTLAGETFGNSMVCDVDSIEHNGLTNFGTEQECVVHWLISESVTRPDS